MNGNSRIRFNPATGEIEIEGSESFVRIYFDKLQALAAETATKLPETAKVMKAIREEKVKDESKATKRAPAQKVNQSVEEDPDGKRVTNISAVVSLIQASEAGLSTAALKEKTGLSERQIWSIVNRASKEGRIRKEKRGVYVRA